MFVEVAPVLVPLARACDGPVLSLAGFGAVGPLIAAGALEESPTDFEAKGTVPGDRIVNLEINRLCNDCDIVSLIVYTAFVLDMTLECW